MIRQWNLGRENDSYARNGGVFTPTPGDFHLFICSAGIPKSRLIELLHKHSLSEKNIIYESIKCRNDVHPNRSENVLFVVKT